MASLATKAREAASKVFRQQFRQSSLAAISNTTRNFTSTTTPIDNEWSVKGLKYKRIDPNFDSNILFQFNKTYGSTPLNFIPDEPVKEHLAKIKTGETIVWGAFDEKIHSQAQQFFFSIFFPFLHVQT